MTEKQPTNRIINSDENGYGDESESTEFSLGAKSPIAELNAKWKSKGPFPFASFAFAMITATAIVWLVYYFTTQAIQVRAFKKQIEELENRK